jgi:hypothetical protein
MRSVRLDDELEAIARQAANLEGASMSEFMRRAIEERARRTLAGNAEERLSDVIGAVHGGGKRARDSGRAFGDLLSERHKQS